MWDVRNEYLYLTAEAEGKFSNTHIAAFGGKDDSIFDKSKSEALTHLKSQTVDMVKGIKK